MISLATHLAVYARIFFLFVCRFGESPRTVDDILTSVVREFGPVALRPVHKGANVGWFLDQMMVSLLVAGWTKRHGTERVKFVPRDVGIDRVDRNSWSPGLGAANPRLPLLLHFLFCILQV